DVDHGADDLEARVDPHLEGRHGVRGSTLELTRRQAVLPSPDDREECGAQGEAGGERDRQRAAGAVTRPGCRRNGVDSRVHAPELSYLSKQRAREPKAL